MKKQIFMLACVALLAGAPVAHQAFAADDDFGGGEIQYKSVVFSHESHVGDMEFDCETCHDDLFEMEANAIANDPEFSMDAIYEGNYCGACHDGDMAFASDEDCTSCHTSDGGKIVYTKPVKAVIFSHETHNEMALGCDSCHTGLFAMESLAAQENDDFTMESLYQGEYCGACHDGSMAFASDTRCATCHIGVKGYERLQGSSAEKSAHAGH